MAHVQRRCATCSTAVPRTRRACPHGHGTTFSYKVRYVDPDGREKSRTFNRKALADDFAASIEHHTRAGSYVDPVAGRQTVRAYLEEWRKGQVHLRPNTAEAYRRRFDRMVYPQIGDLPIGRVRPSTIRNWQRQLVEHPYAPATIKVVRGVVSGAFADAVRDRRLAANPFTGVKGPELVREKVVPLTIDQVRAGQAALHPWYQAIVPVAAGTGLRPSELFGLTVDRVNFLRRTVRVDRQLAGRRGAQPIFGPPKTKSSDRTVPAPKLVLDALAAHLAAYPASEHGLVFTTRRGTPITRQLWTEAWAPAQAAMGLDTGDGLHQLRHFYASLLIADGRPVVEVQERLGHATAQETLETYSHLWHDSDDGTRSAIDDAFTTHETGATPKDDAAET